MEYSWPPTEVFECPPTEEIKKYRIVVVTCVTAGVLYALGIPDSHFTHVMIDEAGHATEPECIIPISGLAG